MDSFEVVTAESLIALQTALDDGLIPSSDKDIAEAEESILQAEDSKKKMQELLVNLHSQVQDLKHFVKLQHAFIHPLRRLPWEILREIIGWCLHMERAYPMSTEVLPDMWTPAHVDLPLERSSVPLRLSHVSRSWRAILHSRPDLWASVSVQIKKHHTQDVLQRGCHLLALHLQNSGTHPLEINITVSPEVSWQLAQMLPDHIAGLLMSQQSRWRRCILNMAPIDFNRLFTGQEAFPLLSHLTLAFYPALVGSKLAFLRAPNVTFLQVTGVKSPEAFGSLAISLYQVENLILDFCLVKLLSYAGPTLSSICFDGFGAYKPMPSTITIPATVTSATFSYSEVGIAPHFNNLVLPVSLHTLNITIYNGWNRETSRALFGLLTRSYPIRTNCRINRIAVSGLELKVWEMRALLRFIPYLVELELSRLWWNGHDFTLEAFFELLRSFPPGHLGTSDLLVPLLRTLRIEDAVGLRDCGQDLEKVTRSLHGFLKERRSLAAWDQRVCSVENVDLLFGTEYDKKHTIVEIVHDARVAMTDRIYT
ncbi:hypothetical protein DL96DRAFT_1571872 [Flagelloscypha sp. PMI_526]|nr:hypothetical protein DL96DRAFT_1571872 [Flagelloscypha sp. PMI_526]